MAPYVRPACPAREESEESAGVREAERHALDAVARLPGPVSCAARNNHFVTENGNACGRAFEDWSQATPCSAIQARV